MVDPDPRNSPRHRQTFGHLDANQQTAHEPRSRSHRDPIDTLHPPNGLYRSHDNVSHPSDMLTRRYLWHDSAKGRVRLHLGVNHIGHNAGTIFHHSSRCFVAARLYA